MGRCGALVVFRRGESGPSSWRKELPGFRLPADLPQPCTGLRVKSIDLNAAAAITFGGSSCGPAHGVPGRCPPVTPMGEARIAIAEGERWRKNKTLPPRNTETRKCTTE